MTRKTTTAITTACTTACVGAAVGAAAYMLSGGKAANAKAKKLKKSTGRALRQVGDFIDNVSYMMK